MDSQTSVPREVGKERLILTPLLLPIITLGIYSWVWLYKINNEMLNHTGNRAISPVKTVGFLFIPLFNVFWGIYLLFHIPGLIKEMEMDDEIPMTEQTKAGFLGICGIIPVVNLAWAPLVQNALNRHWRRHKVDSAKPVD